MRFLFVVFVYLLSFSTHGNDKLSCKDYSQIKNDLSSAYVFGKDRVNKNILSYIKLAKEAVSKINRKSSMEDMCLAAKKIDYYFRFISISILELDEDINVGNFYGSIFENKDYSKKLNFVSPWRYEKKFSYKGEIDNKIFAACKNRDVLNATLYADIYNYRWLFSQLAEHINHRIFDIANDEETGIIDKYVDEFVRKIEVLDKKCLP